MTATLSYLINKILEVDIAPGSSRMPLNEGGNVVLCEEEINAIRQWIDDAITVAVASSGTQLVQQTSTTFGCLLRRAAQKGNLGTSLAALTAGTGTRGTA